MMDVHAMVAAFAARARREAADADAAMSARRQRAKVAADALVDELGATEVILFGSLVEGDVHAGSDVDLAVRGLCPERYFEALNRAADILGCDVDLVVLESARARESLRARIAESGVVLRHA